MASEGMAPLGGYRGVLALALTALSLVAAPAVTLAHEASSPPLWQLPQLADRSPPFASFDGLAAISCPSTSACVALSGTGHALSSTDPTGGPTAWTPTTIGTEHGSIRAVSCASSSQCVATDTNGDVITSADPMASSPKWEINKVDDGQYNALDAVSCPSASLCVATDYEGNVLSSTDPTGGAGAWKLVRVDEGPTASVPRGFAGVSCPTTNLCVAVDYEGRLFSSTRPTGDASAWQMTQIELPPGSTEGLNAVSCPSASFCAIGGHGVILTSTAPTNGAGAWQVTNLGVNTEVRALACSSRALCVAGASANEGILLGSSDPTGGAGAWNISRGTGVEVPTGASCPSS